MVFLNSNRSLKSKTYTINLQVVSLYEKQDVKSELVSQALYGENFCILEKNNDWILVKLHDDNYKGWILNYRNYNYFKTNYIVNIPCTWVYSSPDIKSYTRIKLFAGSKLNVVELKKSWAKVEIADKKPFYGYIPFNHIVNINEKINWLKIIKQFENAPYLWGGKTVNGIDCSALLQLSIKFLGFKIPRDTKDQKDHFQNFILKDKYKKLQKGDLIFWKGHVAVVLNNKQLIHANAFHMLVKVEKIESALQRINQQYVVIRM